MEQDIIFSSPIELDKYALPYLEKAISCANTLFAATVTLYQETECKTKTSTLWLWVNTATLTVVCE